MVTKFILKIVIFLFLLINVSVFAATPRLKRVCASMNGDITLSWFPFNETCNGVINIIIYARQNGSSSFKIIDSFYNAGQFEYLHKNAKNTYINGDYFIQYVLDCNGRTVVTSDTLKIDIAPPAAIEPDSISVNNGEVVLGWKPATESDAKGYIIYRTVGSQNFPVDTVFGKLSTFYRSKKNSDPNAGEERFKIAVLDSCDNTSVSGNFHKTIFLSASQDACKKEIYLNWSLYRGWLNGADKYDLWIWNNSDPNEKPLIVSLKGTEKYFIFKNGKANTKYSFYIHAFKKGEQNITSTSNIILLQTTFSAPLEYLFLKNISIQGISAKLVWEVSSANNITYFKIRRGKDSLLMRDSFIVNSNGTLVNEFMDNNLNVDRDIKYYLVEAYDKCGNLTGKSKISRNIVAKVIKVKGGRMLRWNSYLNFPGSVAGYEIYRSINTADPNKWQLIGNTPKGTHNFIDTDSLADSGNESTCYYIKALEGDSGVYYFGSNSISNITCYYEDALVKVPNAFLYNGLSPEFKPLTKFADLSRSGMKIYNRWGEVIFETKDLFSGWDGKLANGERAPQGVYFYTILIVGRNLRQQSFSGKFTLL
jgi:gliding motility-associated-like protein